MATRKRQRESRKTPNKRVASKVAPQSGSVQSGGKQRAQKPSAARRFFYQLKYQFPKECREFVKILNEFSDGRIDINDMIDRVTVLFRNHPLLIGGFEPLLPPKCRIELPDGQKPMDEDSGLRDAIARLTLKSRRLNMGNIETRA